jgi:hypothetical protein
VGKLTARVRKERARWCAEGRPLTPRMIETLRSLVFSVCPAHCGRPTKQRLVKYGLAEYVMVNGDWDDPIVITDDGAKLIATVPRKAFPVDPVEYVALAEEESK